MIADAHLDRLEAWSPAELPLLEHASCCRRAASRAGPARAAHEPLDGPDGRARRRARRRSPWTDDARIMFTSGTTGRSKGAIKQHASDYFSARTYIEVLRAARRAPEDCATDLFSCLPLFHSNAQVLAAYPAMIAGRPDRLRRALLVGRLLAAGRSTPAPRSSTRSARSSTSSGTRRPGRSTGPTACARIMAMPAPKDIYQRVRGALRHPLHRGLRAHRDRHGHLPPDRAPPRPGLLRRRHARARGERRRARHRPAPAARHPGRDRGRHEDPEHRHARLRGHAREDGRGLPQPQAPHRRPRAHGRGRLPLLPRPGEGLHPPPRRERQLDGGRAGRLRPPATCRGRGRRRQGRRGRVGRGRDPRLRRPRAPRPTRPSSPSGSPSACPTSRCRATCAWSHALPKTPTERVRKVELRDAGITADTFDREAAGIRISR